MEQVRTIWTNYRNPILIGIAVIVVLWVFYYFFKSPSGEGFDDRGYPGYENFYGPEAFQGGYPPMTGAMGAMGQLGAKQAMGQEPAKGAKKMVLFFAPWCPHCKQFMEGENAPWSAFARKNASRKDLNIEQINCDEKPEAATQFGIGGFPTILLFKDGKTYTYDGDRSLESLEKFADSDGNGNGY